VKIVAQCNWRNATAAMELPQWNWRGDLRYASVVIDNGKEDPPAFLFNESINHKS
jgi:hypothetical protein